MFYDKNNEELTAERFANPDSTYRGAPFWAWNTDLKKDELIRQIGELKKMGFGGFFMHTRAGMNTPYLGDEFMELIRACRDEAKKHDMLAYLYDEDRWPSGAAGGIVTENPDYRVRYLVFSRDGKESMGEYYVKTLAAYDVVLTEDGLLSSFVRINETDMAKGEKWYAYLKSEKRSGWFNGATYLSTTNKKAVDKFIDVTYEAYKREVGEDFGGVVPAIFTDEPRYGGFENQMQKDYAKDGKSVSFAFDDNFTTEFAARRGYDILDVFPAIVWNDQSGKSAQARYDYYLTLTELYSEAFADRIGGWCAKNGIAFTGHIDGEESMWAQAMREGDAMRFYRSEGLPGIDLLCDDTSFQTAKQAQSVARQYGKIGVMSELYGVTGWDFDFRGHKYQGDWQAALGITLRVPHLSWVSMRGSAKRDYPASISYQSSWYREYPMIEDHFARVNTALTRGEAVVKVAVLHPMRSMWTLMGDREHNGGLIADLDNDFRTLSEWLLRGQIDFDYVSESLVDELYEKTEKGLKMGKMTYDVLVIPPIYTLHSTMQKIIEEFLSRGGKVIYTGEIPALTDGKPSDEPKRIFSKATCVPFDRSAVLREVECVREVDVRGEDGTRPNNYIYNMRRDGNDKWLFVVNGDKTYRTNGKDSVKANITVTLKGCYKPTLYDTVTGEIIENIPYYVHSGKTRIPFGVYPYDSLLIKLSSATDGDKIDRRVAEEKAVRTIRFDEKVSYALDEPNVLVLDMPEWSMDGKSYEPREEMLRIDAELRKIYGYPAADGHDVQPWKIKETEPDKFPYLRFTFDSDADVSGCKFAYERATELSLNGEKVGLEPNGWFTDTDIYTTGLPTIKKGKNVLVVRAPISKRVSLENFFILGNFGVKVEGSRARLTELPDSLAFGSITGQGFPFYGGAVTYKLPIESKGGNVKIKADYYEGAVMVADVDGKRAGRIAFSPYELDLGNLTAGKHTIGLTLYASRVNAFGSLHCCVPLRWKGPVYWYQKGANFSYEYCLAPVGVMKSPLVETEEK